MSEDSLINIDLGDESQEDQQGNDNQAVEPRQKPEGLSDDLWDAETNDVKKDALLEAYKKEQEKALGLRNILSKKGGIPATSAEELTLQFEENDPLRDIIPDDDKGVEVFRKVALEAGLSKEVFEKLVKGYVKGMSDEGLIQAPSRLTPEEQATLQEAADKKFREEQMKILGNEGQQELKMLEHEFSTLAKRGSLTKEDIEVLQDATFDAKGVRAIAKLIKRYKGETIIPTEHAISNNILSREELDAMGLDPRMKTDEAFRRRRSQGYEDLAAAGML